MGALLPSVRSVGAWSPEDAGATMDSASPTACPLLYWAPNTPTFVEVTMSSAPSFTESAIPRPVDWTVPVMDRVRRAAAAWWHWLFHNCRVALTAASEANQAVLANPAGLRSLIRKTRIALVTTRDRDGKLHTQPLEQMDRDFDGELWFATPGSAPLVAHLRAHADVQVTCVEPASSRCVILDGIARVFGGTDSLRPGWRPGLAWWRHRGRRDPAEAVIRIDVVSADVWE